ncbi:mitochondrial import inner membrane translocase subunit Tim9-like [Dysidea avara]|uniref:mitochondrial import inner membrane translocase subunit Tim9-like n=1 Tax=Dysidea avara TaxID=196820 RepID=UPI003317066B
MDNLSQDQKNQLEISQFKDFMSTFNQVTESCFTDCVNDFTTRRLTKQEADCTMHCVDKYIKMTQRLSLRLQEHMQIQQTPSPDNMR